MLQGKGVVIGCYEIGNELELTDAGNQLDTQLGGKIRHLLNMYVIQYYILFYLLAILNLLIYVFT